MSYSYEAQIERARVSGRKQAEAALHARVETVISDFCAQYERTGYKHCMEYAAVIWAHFSKGGSDHPADRIKIPREGV